MSQTNWWEMRKVNWEKRERRGAGTGRAERFFSVRFKDWMFGRIGLIDNSLGKFSGVSSRSGWFSQLPWRDSQLSLEKHKYASFSVSPCSIFREKTSQRHTFFFWFQHTDSRNVVSLYRMISWKTSKLAAYFGFRCQKYNEMMAADCSFWRINRDGWAGRADGNERREGDKPISVCPSTTSYITCGSCFWAERNRRERKARVATGTEGSMHFWWVVRELNVGERGNYEPDFMKIILQRYLKSFWSSRMLRNFLDQNLFEVLHTGLLYSSDFFNILLLYLKPIKTVRREEKAVKLGGMVASEMFENEKKRMSTCYIGTHTKRGENVRGKKKDTDNW